ncbi:ROK family transcriptional regulator [Herbiconiux sp. CPCC 205763]|uniref:ROK family transcriptional regulator n=1 Tax=Herbiconiux aconitum TaxID=2970913 RepID=A0ABT2GLW0_9MICO|nr:ROK family transcriptional regulator [Herbiconiux aconitum]MCS5717198.1 ROK family transcriptional regulator [Herbiconiux aconitum]
MAEKTGSELRRTNLSAVLTLVHSRGVVTRAEITRETGLNRSTVGALVGELVELRLVRESEDAAHHVGRPSLLIEPERRTVALSVHATPDAVTIGLVDLGGHVIKRIRCGTVRVPRPEEVVNIVTAVVAGMRTELDRSYSTVGVGLAVPGPRHSVAGVPDAAPDVDWQAAPLAERLERALGLPVFAAGDAVVGALAESTFGAARGMDDLVFVTGGPAGVTAAVIGGGTLLTGANGSAGAVGHLLVTPGGALCPCGSRGCLDTELSEEALLEALGATAGADLATVLGSRRGDPVARAVVHRGLDHLAVAVRTVVNLVDPQLVVLGGYLAAMHDLAPDRLRTELGRSVMRRAGQGAGLRITRAGLGDDLLVVGAAQLALSRVLRDPAQLPARAPAV